MGRPRAFDETEVIRAAAELFASRAYDGVSVDDLVTTLGVHRNSLYKVFGSKRGLYLAALRWYLAERVSPVLAELRTTADPAAGLQALLTSDRDDLDLLILAVVERAPADQEVADLVAGVLREVDAAVARALPAEAIAPALTATILGLRLRARAGGTAPDAGTVLLHHIQSSGT
ncbi:MAG: TetR/AcrR family transcriptional regulator [Hamadaea sp.]|uniref:TetR/AcrR family transcriptional regulator n=1 Tax=Hamadaea sp. TaxID=2024425 RepID=UPI00185DE883|nr:TetR/AcrR family transcriptional regulator [Hamadaea sp.]NUR70329.1 TetR/AcrR family transcriptional regulator [Hamadaea sp.]NUT21949.1 TetR/AcrR family transcriptional regulator [Hamadaea sp.]